LTVSEHAARASIDEKAMAQARQFKVTNVLFRGDGTIAEFEQVPSSLTAPRALGT
jgi:hypothetical protein